MSRIYREFKNSTPKELITYWRNGHMNWIGNFQGKFSKEVVQMANKYVKKCSASPVIFITRRFHLILVRTAVIKNINKARCQWLTLIILATWETEIRRIIVWSQSGQIIHETLSWKTLSQKNWAGGVAQGEIPEFKPQYHKNKTKLN
jgi:hypothetical protein